MELPMSTAGPDPLVANLNARQVEAVTHAGGPLLILAGPGSGKTRVLTHRIAWLIRQGVDSRSILALTFTNKAANELTDRVAGLVRHHHAWTSTFHRFCSRLLRTYGPFVGLTENFTIYDSADSRKVVKEALATADIQSPQYSGDKIASEISRIKSRGLLPEDITGRAGNHLLAAAQQVYPAYQDLLQRANAVDFDDLLLYVVQLLRENSQVREQLAQRHQHVLVDEYQDTNQAQYLILQGLCAADADLTVTGDPDQSIYGWRGANLSNILQFEQDFKNVKTVRLEHNYRSTGLILNAADQLICNNIQRKQKSLITDNDAGQPISLTAMPTQQEEARQIADSIVHEIQDQGRNPRDIAVFYRLNYLSRSIEKELIERGIPYQIVHGLEFFSRREVKDVLAYMHVLNNPNDNLALQRIINVPSRKIGAVTLKRLKNFANDNRISLMDAARQAGMISEISTSVATKIARFVALYDQLAEHRMEKVEALIGHIISKTGYRDYLLLDNDEEAHQRAANVDELMSAAREFDIQHGEESNLERFLEQAILINETDAWETTAERVTLMTLHAAKGLEFSSVYIIGLEDGILPHERSANDPQQLEEERRLLFVGITRAMHSLHLSYTMNRFRRGSHWPTIPSKFLLELPRSQMRVTEPKRSRIDLPRNKGYDVFNQEAGLGNGDAWDVREANADYAPHGHPSAFPRLADNRTSKKSGKRAGHMPPIKTAAQMLGADGLNSPPVHPNQFQFGMVVSHPEYGTGKITAMSGEGKKRQATVSFFGGAEKIFRLAHAPLRLLS